MVGKNCDQTPKLYNDMSNTNYHIIDLLFHIFHFPVSNKIDNMLTSHDQIDVKLPINFLAIIHNILQSNGVCNFLNNMWNSN